MPIILSPQQKLICKALLHTRRVNIFADPGTGKTFSVWAFLEQLLAAHPSHRVLIVAPKLVIQMNWESELITWNKNHKIKYDYLTAPFDNLEDKLDPSTQVFFMNVDGGVKLHRVLEKRKQLNFFTTIIMDESSILRNHDCYIRVLPNKDPLKPSRETIYGSRTQAASCIVKLATHAVRYINMTGSMSPNGYENIWAQMLPVDKGERLGRSKTSFLERYMKVENPKSRYPNFIIREEMKKIVYEKIMDQSLYIKCEAEPPNIITHDIELGAEALGYHKRMHEDLCARVQGDIEEVDIFAVNQAARITKCLQISNGFLYENPELKVGKNVQKKKVIIHDAKIKYLQQLMAEIASPMILVYTYETDKQRVLDSVKGAELLPATPAQQALLLPKWDAGEIPLLVLPARRAAYGLNLHKSCHDICFFNPIYDYDLAYQVIERIGTNRQLKIGSGFIPNVHFLLGKKTFDHTVYKNFIKKGSTMREGKEIMEHLQLTMPSSLYQRLGGLAV